jgi:hypothetical protein
LNGEPGIWPSLAAVLRTVLAEPALPVSPEIEREAVLHPGLTDEKLAAHIEAQELFARLPARHQALLRLTNGMEILGDSYRLFGIDNGRTASLVAWNRPATWKFAWKGEADPYLCFGESVLGNQDAYRWDELASAGAKPRVYELYAVTLEPILDYGSFEELLRQRYALLADDPYHARIRQARERLGSFRPDQHLVYVPSPLLVEGRVDVQELMPMDAATAMILQGDLASQLGSRESLDGFEGLETYQDQEGRERIRVRWSGSGKEV